MLAMPYLLVNSHCLGRLGLQKWRDLALLNGMKPFTLWKASAHLILWRRISPLRFECWWFISYGVLVYLYWLSKKTGYLAVILYTDSFRLCPTTVRNGVLFQPLQAPLSIYSLTIFSSLHRSLYLSILPFSFFSTLTFHGTTIILTSIISDLLLSITWPV